MRLPSPRRTAIAAALIAMPAVVSAIGLTAIELYRVVQPRAPLFGEPAAASLAAAIAQRSGVEEVYRFIRAGQNPNQPLALDDQDYTEGRTIEVSPLLLAVAAGDSNVVQMLVDFGARPDLPQNAAAWCLARQLGDDVSARVIAAATPDGRPPDCPEPRPQAATPLLAWVVGE